VISEAFAAMASPRHRRLQNDRICALQVTSAEGLSAAQGIQSSLRLLSSGCQGFFEVGFDGEGVAAPVPGRIVVPGSVRVQGSGQAPQQGDGRLRSALFDALDLIS
jgi:hypothetical protein